jgi:hypothetical protein
MMIERHGRVRMMTKCGGPMSSPRRSGKQKREKKERQADKRAPAVTAPICDPPRPFGFREKIDDDVTGNLPGRHPSFTGNVETLFHD